MNLTGTESRGKSATKIISPVVIGSPEWRWLPHTATRKQRISWVADKERIRQQINEEWKLGKNDRPLVEPPAKRDAKWKRWRDEQVKKYRQQLIAEHPELEGQFFSIPIDVVLTGRTIEIIDDEPADMKAKRLARIVAAANGETTQTNNAKPAPSNSDSQKATKRETDFDPPDETTQNKVDNFKDPVDLWAVFNPPELPRGLLPKLIEDFAFTTAEDMGVDPGGVAMAALAVCAAAIDDRIRLRMKKHSENWMESARIWVALIGDPSSKKSPILKAVRGPIAKLDAAKSAKYNQEMAEWLALTKEEQADNPAPLRVRHRFDDVTLESLQDGMRGSPGGALLDVDELSGLIGGWDKYSSGGKGASKDRGAYLSTFNGGELPVDRVRRGTFIVPNWSLSMMCGIQPEVVRKMANDSYDDGFYARMFTVVLNPASVGKDAPAPKVADQYEQLVGALSELVPPPATQWHVNHSDVVLRFDAEAQELRNRLEVKHHELMGMKSINRKLVGHVGKLDGLFGRLCIIWHCVEHAHDKNGLPAIVTIDTAKRVADFMDVFLMRHAMAFFAGVLGLSDDDDELKNLAGYILSHRAMHLTIRDAQRASRVMRKLKHRDVVERFEQMESLGWIAREIDRRGRPTNFWTVNSVLHIRFADQAKRERADREAARKLIAQAVAARRDGQ